MISLSRTLFLVLSLICRYSYSQVSLANESSLRIKPTADFQITGDGTAPSWQNTDWIILPKRGGTSLYATKTKLLYSDKGIYTLFHCEDQKITATLQQDFDTLWREDVVELFIWPDESTPLYFEYQISPLNYELVLLVPNFNGDFMGWQPWQFDGERKTEHEVTVTRNEQQGVTGWIAEVFIPYLLLKPLQNVPPKKGTQWRMNIYRIDYDETPSSKWAWKPVKTNFHDYKRFGKVVFVE